MRLNTKIYIAGHQGLVGSAINRQLTAAGYKHILVCPSGELDLRDQQAVQSFFEAHKPEVVIDAAAKVGGILSNQNEPYSFLMDNLMIQNNLIHSAHKTGVSKFIFLGSSCIYPKHAAQPLIESALLTGALEPTNAFYAVAKIAGLKACEAIKKTYSKAFITLLPSNLYGPNDHFNIERGHVIPALFTRFYHAKIQQQETVILWGDGTPLREFLFVDDLANAIQLVLETDPGESCYNIGSSHEISIHDLAVMIQRIVGYEGAINWDSSQPNGTPRKLLNSRKIIDLGWKPSIDLQTGLKITYEWFLANHNTKK